MILKNQKEKSIWMNERMNKGYSFRYEKEWVYGSRVNVRVICSETHEVFYFDWYDSDKS